MGKDFTVDLGAMQVNTTENFISTSTKAYTPTSTKTNEAKSKRIQLVLKPSFYEIVREEADKRQLSVNALFTTAVAEYINKK